MSVRETSYSRRAAHLIGLSLLILLNLMVALSVVVLASELFVADRFMGPQAEDPREEPEADELVRRGYYPAAVKVDPYKQFEILQPHPVYGWFWRANEDGGFAQRNGAVTIDHDGFRDSARLIEEARASQKPLAFLLGGSAAFGYRASRDATTITAYLNKAQSSFIFVNAGVPGWDSGQERIRLEHQVVGYAPKLVIAYTLFNDVERTIETLEFAKGPLQRFFDRIAPKTSYLVGTFVHERLPTVESWMRRRPTLASLEAAIDKQIDTFVANQEIMYSIARKNGIRFVTVIQPMTMTHQNATLKGPYSELYQRAVQRALASKYCRQHCLDYSNVFDALMPRVQVFYEDYVEPALERSVDLENVVFADQCHLLDAGNAIVARKLATDLKLEAANP
jgi:hypothetical protein